MIYCRGRPFLLPPQCFIPNENQHLYTTEQLINIFGTIYFAEWIMKRWQKRFRFALLFTIMASSRIAFDKSLFDPD